MSTHIIIISFSLDEKKKKNLINKKEDKLSGMKKVQIFIDEN